VRLRCVWALGAARARLALRVRRAGVRGAAAQGEAAA